MTLLVCAYTRDANGGMDFLETDGSDQLAGFETCRQTLWGSHAVVSLGMTLLPSLAHGDLIAEGDDLTRLEMEVQTIVSNLDFVAQQTGYSLDFIQSRTQNILTAVKRAKQVEGGIVIW